MERWTLVESPSGVACIRFVRSPESGQESEVAAGERVTVTGMAEAGEVGGGWV